MGPHPVPMSFFWKQVAENLLTSQQIPQADSIPLVSEQSPCTHLKQLDPTAQIDVDVDVPSGNLT